MGGGRRVELRRKGRWSRLDWGRNEEARKSRQGFPGEIGSFSGSIEPNGPARSVGGSSLEALEGSLVWEIQYEIF